MSREQRGAGVAEPPDEGQGDAQGAGPSSSPPRSRVGGREGEAAERAAHGPARGVLREYFESLVVTAVMALFGMTFVVQAVKVPTGSMQNTILIGDHLLVNKFIFAPGPSLPFLPQREIRRGDIIVFKYPGKYQGEERFRDSPEVDDERPDNIPYKTNYVKRVIGLPGDVVEVRDAKVLINGQPLGERVVAALNHEDDPETPGNEADAPLEILNDSAPPGEEPYNAYFDDEKRRVEVMYNDGKIPGDGKFIVPEDHYFAMGDNRDNSLDSRFWGYVPRSAITGRAMFVYWSYDESLPSTGNFLTDFFKNSRWGRTGTLVK